MRICAKIALIIQKKHPGIAFEDTNNSFIFAPRTEFQNVMDRNTIIGLLVIFAILIVYSIYITPSEEEREALKRKQDSIQRVHRMADSMAAARLAEKKIRDSITAVEQTDEPVVTTDTVVPDTATGIRAGLRDKFGLFAGAARGKDEIYTLENDVLELTLASKGGKILTARLKEFQTYDSLPLILFDSEATRFGLQFFMNNRLINTNELYFRPYSKHGTPLQTNRTGTEGQDSTTLLMRLYADNDREETDSYIEYRYTVYEGKYMIDFDVRFSGLNEITTAGSNYLDIFWYAELLKQEKTIDRFNGPTIYYKYYDDEVDYLSETKDDEESLITRVKWVSFKQRFFTATLIADRFFSNAEVKAYTTEEKGERYLKTMETQIGVSLDPKTGRSLPMRMYFGPNKFNRLKKYDLDLEKQIPIGWSFFLMAWINRFLVLPVFNFLEGFGWNYGIIILVLTILLKIVLFPIAYKSYKSSAKMRVLKPEIDEINSKYPKKEDAMKKQQAVMSLYKQAGVNPMAGCIPMLLQFPILIAMFRFFPASFELRQESFLWADDLSTYDSILDLPFNIPFYGDHVSLFTLLMTISTIMYTKVNNDLMGSSSQQLPGMKTMMYIMPIMFLGIFNSYASGLSYYYLLANLITFLQMFLIRKTINESKIRKQIEINKKKPKKKSKWQQRLEEAAKKRGYPPPRR